MQRDRRRVIRMRVLDADQLGRITLTHRINGGVYSPWELGFQRNNIVKRVKREPLPHYLVAENVKRPVRTLALVGF